MATTVGPVGPEDSDIIKKKINEKLKEITYPDNYPIDKEKLSDVFSDLRNIRFKEKVLIYKCLREGTFNCEEFYQEFMKLADTDREPGWSKAFADLRNRVIRNYGCESQKKLVRNVTGSPGFLFAKLSGSKDLFSLANTSKSGLQEVIGRTTGKTETVKDTTYTLSSTLKECTHLVSVTIPHHYTDVSVGAFKDLPADSKLCKIKCYDEKIYTELTSTSNKGKYFGELPVNIEVCRIDRSNESHIIETASIKVSDKTIEGPTLT